MKKIIIVEDEEILRNLLQRKLTEEGYEVEAAQDGEEGLKKIKEDRPDLILLDIIMPKMGGFEMLEAMQKEEGLTDIPVIVVSNSGQPVEIDRAQQLGASDWLVKTEFNPQEVIDKVVKQIGKGEKSENEGGEDVSAEEETSKEETKEEAEESPNQEEQHNE